MNGYETGIFICDGALIYVPVGFVPDKVEMYELTSDALMYQWWKGLEDAAVAAALSSIEGILYDVDSGAASLLADGGGFASYDTGAEGPTVSTWTSAVATAATARTATARGTLVKPSTSGTDTDGQNADRSMIFECVTAGTSSGTEPTWPTAIGDQVLDSDVLFELVNEASIRTGYQGFRVAAALMANGEYHVYDAWKANKTHIWGDVDGWPSGVNENVR